MPEFEDRMKEAVARVESFDKSDGFRDRNLRTIISALEAGLRNPESGAQFDAYWMLLDLPSRPVNVACPLESPARG